MARPKKNWKVIVFEKDKKKGEFKGEFLLEALVKAEEEILFFNPNSDEYEES
jgi:hypothetical protein